MSKWSRISALALAAVLTGCGSTSRQPPIQIFSDMRQQPKFKNQELPAQLVPGTVAQGQLTAHELTFTRETLRRGQERFNIYCAPCHDRTGSGHGIVALRSSWLPGNLHDPRIKSMSDEELFGVVTNGRRTMPAYRFQVPADDRWAIVAYVRALQRATSATIDDVPADLRGDLR